MLLQKRLTADEEQRLSQRLSFVSIFLFLLLSFSCVALFLVARTQQLSWPRTLQVSACLGRQDPDAGGVAGLTEDVSIQGVAALVVSFGQKTTTVLTAVALHVEITVQSHNSDGLLLAWGRHDRVLAHRTAWGKFLVEVLNAVNETASVYGKRDAIQATVAHHAGEAVGVVCLPGGTEDPLHDWLRTHAALLQRIDVAGLAVGLLLHGVERLSSELDTTDHAGEAIHMEDLIHGGASCSFSNYVFPTVGTAAKIIIGRWVFHVIQHLLGQVFELIFWAERWGNRRRSHRCRVSTLWLQWWCTGG